MAEEKLRISVKIDGKTFRKFALFDTWLRQKRWHSPAIFAALMLVFSVLCFLLRNLAEGAVLLGAVLLGVGLLLPAGYFLSFLLGVNGQIQKMGLEFKAKEVYTLELDRAEGVAVSNGTEQVKLGWAQLYGAYRVKDCTYLYATPGRAYLLPDGQIEGGGNALWALLDDCLPPEKRIDRRK